MGKNIDLTQPLSDEDRAWLEERGSVGELRVADEYARTASASTAADPTAGTPYEGMNKEELAELLEARGLAKSGNKDDLVQRLVENDSNQQ